MMGEDLSSHKWLIVKRCGCARKDGVGMEWCCADKKRRAAGARKGQKIHEVAGFLKEWRYRTCCMGNGIEKGQGMDGFFRIPLSCAV